MNDHALLQEYVRDKSEAAFETLSKRYVALVYSAALRRTGDTHMAEDVTQAVFVVLAQKAKQLPASTTLPAWLLSVTRLVANNARRQRGNQRKSTEAAMDSFAQTRGGDSTGWDEIAPLLDDAVAELPDVDRNAVVLRFFQKHSFEDVGIQLGISSDAAKKRVERALEKLRRFFVKNGVNASALALGILITNEAVRAAPAGLVAGLPAAVIAAQTGIHIGQSAVLAKGAIHTMTMMTVKKFVVAALILLVGLVGGGAIASAVIYKSQPSAGGAPSAKPIALEEKAQEPNPPPPLPPAPAPAKDAAEVDLMPLIDKAPNAVNGIWSIENKELVNGRSPDGRFDFRSGYSRFEFPYQAPEEYDFKIVFTVKEIFQDVLMICAKGNTVFAFKMGQDNNHSIAIEYIPTSKSYVKKVFTKDVQVEAVVKVRNTGVSAFMNGEPVTAHQTDYKDMHLTPAWELTTPGCIGVGCFMTPFVLHAASVTEVTGKGRLIPRENAPALKDAWLPPDDAQWNKAVDVLAMADAEKDAVAGVWTRSKSGLTCATGAHSRVELPYRPPEEYDYKIVFKVESGLTEVQQIFPLGKNPIQWCMGGWNNDKNNKNVLSFQGFTRYKDGWNPSSTFLPDYFKTGTEYTSVIQVRKTGCVAFMNGKYVSRTSFKTNDGHVLPEWAMPTAGLLGFGAHNCAVTIQSAQLVEISGKGYAVPTRVAKSSLPLPVVGRPAPNGSAVKPDGF